MGRRDGQRTEVDEDERLQEQRVLSAVVATREGDREAFGVVYHAYFTKVHAYLRLILRDEHDAEEVTQETFLRALRGLDGFRPRDGVPFRAWLFRIARNTAGHRLAKRGRSTVTEPEIVAQRADAQALAAGLAPGVGLGWIGDAALAAAVEALPLAQRQVIVLRFVLGLTAVEAGVVLGRQATGVRQLQHRALRALSAALNLESGTTPTSAPLSRVALLLGSGGMQRAEVTGG